MWEVTSIIRYIFVMFDTVFLWWLSYNYIYSKKISAIFQVQCAGGWRWLSTWFVEENNYWKWFSLNSFLHELIWSAAILNVIWSPQTNMQALQNLYLTGLRSLMLSCQTIIPVTKHFQENTGVSFSAKMVSGYAWFLERATASARQSGRSYSIQW